jgi:hypothetical protein
MKLNIKNETGRLKSVVLGQPKSNGPVPTLEESYDAKSYHTIEIISIQRRRYYFGNDGIRKSAEEI